jgi:hypothetical protein
MALQIAAALSNGMGGIDWAGFPLMVAKFGVDDVDGLIERLVVIKNHQPPKEDDGAMFRQ